MLEVLKSLVAEVIAFVFLESHQHKPKELLMLQKLIVFVCIQVQRPQSV